MLRLSCPSVGWQACLLQELASLDYCPSGWAPTDLPPGNRPLDGLHRFHSPADQRCGRAQGLTAPCQRRFFVVSSQSLWSIAFFVPPSVCGAADLFWSFEISTRRRERERERWGPEPGWNGRSPERRSTLAALWMTLPWKGGVVIVGSVVCGRDAIAPAWTQLSRTLRSHRKSEADARGIRQARLEASAAPTGRKTFAPAYLFFSCCSSVAGP